MSGTQVPGDLAAFFEPRSVAVVGGSRDPTKVGGSVVANLRAAAFEGRIWPVNPRADVVQGVPATASLFAINEPVDLAVIAVPAPDVLPALKECVARGIRGAIVLSAGFREAGEAGQAREAELRAWLREQPIRVLGPNCLGWIRPSRRLNATFAPGMPPAGGIAFLSHSGALATAILDWARARRLGFSFFATLGNKISSPDISHKTDVGGTSLGVSSPAEVARIAAAMLARVRQQRPDATIQGVMVQPMAPPGKELLLGALHDAQFGPLVLVGFGGIYVEVLRDTTDDCAAGHHGARSLGGQLRHRGPRVTTSVLPHRRPIVIQGLLKLEKRL